MRYTYRYSTVSTSSPPHAPSESSGLALDCLLDVDVLPGCQLTMKLRNSQIKRVSPQKENSAQRTKNLREALERNPLMFSLRDGKVAQVCPWEGDPVWALNIKRAIVSMLQTSHAGDPRETVKETDVYGTCVSHYERRGSVLVKTRDLRGCLRDRLAGFWLHSVPLSQDNAVESSVQCVQRHGDSATEEVNCTETVRLAPLAGRPVGARVRSVSTLTLLRAQDGAPQADLFLHLVFQLRVLSHRQLQQLWQEASFKCRDDWQPLLDALPACGSEACVSVMTELLRSGELEPERVSSFLSAFAFVSRPSAAMVGSTTGLLQSPETRTGALLAVSSMVHTLCLRMTSPCSLLPQVQQLLKVLKEMLEELCGEGDGSQLTEKLHVLKAVGNAGLAAATLIPELEVCAQSQYTPMELRLAAIQAFRRIPCTADRRALLQLYCSPREDVEVRIAAYQQIMRPR
ncbi:vitellogenin-like [Scleropages formosus]|uniref:vitellogenin-like n=1 Tax=Scleropages formosus TaxID=113540 RepID=UPI0010FAAA9B|nr:vitellogenin-like [Scleropages formosus]